MRHGFWVERYECSECAKHHITGSDAQVRCEEQQQRVRETHETHPCAKCRQWPAWTDARCAECGTSPKARGQAVRNIKEAGK